MLSLHDSLPIAALARGACARIAATAAACTAITAALIGPLPLPAVRSTEVLRRSTIAAAGRAPSAPARRPQPQRRRSPANPPRSEEHTSELQSLLRISYSVFCLKTKKKLE